MRWAVQGSTRLESDESRQAEWSHAVETIPAWVKLVMSAFFWALMFYLGHYAVGFISPASLNGWRFLAAGLLLLVLVSLSEGQDWSRLRRHALPLLGMAVIGIGGFNLALFHGLRHTSPVNGALIMALCPTLISVLSTLLDGARISGAQLVGLVLGLAGVVVVVSDGSLSALLSLSVQRGELYVLLAAVCWAAYSVFPQRFLPGLPPLQVTVGTIVLGGILISAFAQLTQPDFFIPPPVDVRAAVLDMSLFGSVVAYLWWNDGVRRVGAATAGLFLNPVPVFVLLIGVVLGQAILLAQLVGMVLLIGGAACARPCPASSKRSVAVAPDLGRANARA